MSCQLQIEEGLLPKRQVSCHCRAVPWQSMRSLQVQCCTVQGKLRCGKKQHTSGSDYFHHMVACRQPSPAQLGAATVKTLYCFTPPKGHITTPSVSLRRRLNRQCNLGVAHLGAMQAFTSALHPELVQGQLDLPCRTCDQILYFIGPQAAAILQQANVLL